MRGKSWAHRLEAFGRGFYPVPSEDASCSAVLSVRRSFMFGIKIPRSILRTDPWEGRKDLRRDFAPHRPYVNVVAAFLQWLGAEKSCALNKLQFFILAGVWLLISCVFRLSRYWLCFLDLLVSQVLQPTFHHPLTCRVWRNKERKAITL